VLVRYQDVGALPGHPATFRISSVHHILALQADPASGRIIQLWLRRRVRAGWCLPAMHGLVPPLSAWQQWAARFVRAAPGVPSPLAGRPASLLAQLPASEPA
jgi:hypothetical protein